MGFILLYKGVISKGPYRPRGNEPGSQKALLELAPGIPEIRAFLSKEISARKPPRPPHSVTAAAPRGLEDTASSHTRAAGRSRKIKTKGGKGREKKEQRSFHICNYRYILINQRKVDVHPASIACGRLMHRPATQHAQLSEDLEPLMLKSLYRDNRHLGLEPVLKVSDYGRGFP